jgi:hypothetical protein
MRGHPQSQRLGGNRQSAGIHSGMPAVHRDLHLGAEFRARIAHRELQRLGLFLGWQRFRDETRPAPTYYGADENCFSEAALVADVETASSAVDEVASVVAELAPTESDSLSVYWPDAIKVAITESVILAAPSQEAENSEP